MERKGEEGVEKRGRKREAEGLRRTKRVMDGKSRAGEQGENGGQ